MNYNPALNIYPVPNATIPNGYFFPTPTTNPHPSPSQWPYIQHYPQGWQCPYCNVVHSPTTCSCYCQAGYKVINDFYSGASGTTVNDYYPGKDFDDDLIKRYFTSNEEADKQIDGGNPTWAKDHDKEWPMKKYRINEQLEMKELYNGNSTS